MPTCSLGQPALKTSCFQKSTCRKWVKTEVKGQKRSFFQNVQIWSCGISKVAYQREDYHGVLIFSLTWMVLEISHPIWFGHASRNTPLLPIFACFSVIFLCNIGLFVLKIISEHVRILRCNGIFFIYAPGISKICFKCVLLRMCHILTIPASFTVIFLCNIGLFVLKIISEHLQILRCNGIFNLCTSNL